MAQFEIEFAALDCTSYTVTPTSSSCIVTYNHCVTNVRITEETEVAITFCAKVGSINIDTGTATITNNGPSGC